MHEANSNRRMVGSTIDWQRRLAAPRPEAPGNKTEARRLADGQQRGV
jgi:hypothetical protein